MNDGSAFIGVHELSACCNEEPIHKITVVTAPADIGLVEPIYFFEEAAFKASKVGQKADMEQALVARVAVDTVGEI